MHLHHSGVALRCSAACPVQHKQLARCCIFPAPVLSVRPTTRGPHSRAAPACPPAPTKGSKKLMQSDDGREELRQGSFDLDRTAERILEVRLPGT